MYSINGGDFGGSRQEVPLLGKNNRYTLLTIDSSVAVASGGVNPPFTLVEDGGGGFADTIVPQNLVSRYEAFVVAHFFIDITWSIAPTTGQARINLVHQPSADTLSGFLENRDFNPHPVRTSLTGFARMGKDTYLILDAFNDDVAADYTITGRVLLYTMT